MQDTKHLTDQFLSVCDETPDSNGFVRELLTRVGDKWSILVIATLARGPLRFTKLLHAVPGISHRMLTVTLRSLWQRTASSRAPRTGRYLPVCPADEKPRPQSGLSPALRGIREGQGKAAEIILDALTRAATAAQSSMRYSMNGRLAL